jgi:glycosyltransferase involved in cell wall biosynthesis
MINKRRIVHVIDSLTIGGAEILLRNTIGILPEFDHTVVYLIEPNDVMADFCDGVEFVCLHHHSVRKIFSAAKEFGSIVRARQPLLVHAHLQKSAWVARLANIKTPLISTLHSTYSVDAFAKSSIALWVEKITVGRQKALIGISKNVLNDYLYFVHFKGPSFVVYNFLNDDFFKSYSHERKVQGPLKLVAVGNLKEAKNYPYLLDIMKHLPKDSFTLDIYGDGVLKKELQTKIEFYDLPVRVCGVCKDLKNVLPNYDLFIQVSSHEGFGLTVAEAMALRVPVAVSDIEVFREITGGWAHFLALDEPEKAASSISGLIKDAESRNLYVNGAFEHVQSISSSATYRKTLLSIYELITSN